MAGLRGVDPNLESAARIMGAGKVYTFRKVTLPLLTPLLVVASLITFILFFDELIIAIFLSGFGTHTLPVKIYENITEEVSPVLAAISVIRPRCYAPPRKTPPPWAPCWSPPRPWWGRFRNR